MTFIGYEYITTSEGLERATRAVSECKVIGLDIETVRDVLDPTGLISLIQVSTPTKLFVVDAIALGEPACTPLVNAICDEGIIKIIHHAKFEQKWFYKKYKAELWPVFDTYRASAIIDNGRELPHDLYAVYERYLGMAPPTQDLGGSNWEQRPLSEEQKAYAASDVKFLHSLRDVMKPILANKGLNTIAKIEFGVVLPESVVELNGFPIDKQMWLDLYEENLKKAEEYRKQLVWELPRAKAQTMLPGIEPDLNVNSTQQVLASLQMLGVPIEDTKNETLTLWAADFPLVEKLVNYRDYGQAVKMFGPDYLSALSPWDGRFHPRYFPFTGAGRYSCANKNLQQVPRKFEFRNCFRPRPGRVFVVCDWSNIEMRIAAELSQDENLLKVFRANPFLADGVTPNREADAHYVTASFITGKLLSEIEKYERQNAKPVNFGFLYNMQPPRLVIQARTEYGITMSLKQAREYREKYFEKYVGIRKWHDKIFGNKSNLVRTLAGRIRYLPDDAFNEKANCVDAETEALTKRGWVKGFNLKKEDVLLTKNPDTGKLEWQEMTDLKLFPNYRGKVYEFKSRSFSAVTTPDHRWLVWNKSSGRDEEKTSETLSKFGDHRIHRTGDYQDPPVEEFTNDFVELCGWFLTDGNYYSIPRKKGPNRPLVTLYQSQTGNPEKAAQIEALISRLNIKVWKSVRGERKYTSWGLPVGLSSQLHDIFPDRILTMDFLCRLTKAQASLLMHTMILGDGTSSGGKVVFSTARKESAEMFQALACICGFASSITRRDMSRYKPKSKYLSNIPNMSSTWCVSILKRNKTQIVSTQYEVREEATAVWCPVVPNTFFVARREGHIYITGNTPVQGAGADGLKTALRATYFAFRDDPATDMVHHVHDEIILETDDNLEKATEVKHKLETVMVEAMQQYLKTVPVVAEGKIAPSWAEGK